MILIFYLFLFHVKLFAPNSTVYDKVFNFSPVLALNFINALFYFAYTCIFIDAKTYQLRYYFCTHFVLFAKKFFVCFWWRKANCVESTYLI